MGSAVGRDECGRCVRPDPRSVRWCMLRRTAAQPAMRVLPSLPLVSPSVSPHLALGVIVGVMLGVPDDVGVMVGVCDDDGVSDAVPLRVAV
jgi:hypothetical protein